ncbi:MAG: aspartate-semialdehyde dehydrogenase [Deltaproteobacteria bacterium]|nr:aspartate-semialdehyde dehydrogenase [Deltaproteobacteria bacterium]
MSCTVAVVGATGLVGRAMLRILEERAFPAERVRALASPRSVGTRLPFRGAELEVEEACDANFEGVHIALFSAGAGPSRSLAPAAAARGAVVIDNSSAWRMDDAVPLVVPEVNPEAAHVRPRGIIANPNCSTIQMVVALKPLHDLATIEHIVVSTYQAASGKGQDAVADLEAQLRTLARGERPVPTVFPGPLAGNLLCDWKAGAEDYSEEELKMVNETRKILGDASLGVSPTTVRVPVVTGHSESVFVRFARPLGAPEAKDALRRAPGVTLLDEPYAPGRHPQPIDCAGRDDVFVGRVREDLAVKGALNLWIVSDNLRKGAALNAVQIAELLVAR